MKATRYSGVALFAILVAFPAISSAGVNSFIDDEAHLFSSVAVIAAKTQIRQQYLQTHRAIYVHSVDSVNADIATDAHRDYLVHRVAGIELYIVKSNHSDLIVASQSLNAKAQLPSIHRAFAVAMQAHDPDRALENSVRVASNIMLAAAGASETLASLVPLRTSGSVTPVHSALTSAESRVLWVLGGFLLGAPLLGAAILLAAVLKSRAAKKVDLGARATTPTYGSSRPVDFEQSRHIENGSRLYRPSSSSPYGTYAAGPTIIHADSGIDGAFTGALLGSALNGREDHVTIVNTAAAPVTDDERRTARRDTSATDSAGGSWQNASRDAASSNNTDSTGGTWGSPSDGGSDSSSSAGDSGGGGWGGSDSGGSDSGGGGGW